MRLFSKACVVLFVLSLAAPASAHFVWVKLVHDKDGKPAAHVYFSESAAPGEGNLVDRIAHTAVSFHRAGEKPLAIDVKPAVEGESGVLSGAIDSTASGHLEAVCKYGVFTRGEKTSLLYYYAKCLGGAVPTGDAARAAGLQLDIVPLVADGDLDLQVLWQGKPAAGSQVVAADPAGEIHELETDKSGRVRVGKLQRDGDYNIRARLVVDKPGEDEGKAYQQELHYSTLVFAAPIADAKTTDSAKASDGAKGGDYPELPKGITSFGAAVAEGALYVYGGHFGEAHKYASTSQSHDLLRLNLKQPTKWEVVASGPPLQGLAMVEHGGKLYRVGGFSAHNAEGEEHDLRSVADFVRFDPKTNEWQDMPPLPEPRSSHDAVVMGDKLYVVGGWRLGPEGTQWHETALVADLSQEKPQWSELPKPPFQRRALSLGYEHGKLYAIGGMQQEGGPTTRVDVFDPASGKWSEAKGLVGEGMEGFGSSAFTVGDRLYVSTYGGNLQCLDDRTGEWRIAKKLDDDRFFHRMAPYGGRLVIVGGASMTSGKRLNLESVNLEELKSSGP